MDSRIWLSWMGMEWWPRFFENQLEGGESIETKKINNDCT